MKKIEADLKRKEKAMEKLGQAAEEYKLANDMESYWNLTAPGNQGDLYYIIGRDKEAQAYFDKAIRYFEEYRKWAISQGKRIESNSYEASFYLKADLIDQAQSMYRQIVQGEDNAGKSVCGIALINSGAIEEGKQYLRWRVKNLDKGKKNTPTRWYHLAECYFWLGDYQKAYEYATTAVREWGERDIAPPVLAFHRLTKYALSKERVDKTAATQAFETAICWFYLNDDVGHAFDAREYLKLLNRLEKRQDFKDMKILGMSFMR